MKLPVPLIAATFAEPIGVSFDARWIHAAQVAFVEGKPTLSGATSIRRNDRAPGEPLQSLNQAEVARLKRSLVLQGLGSRQAVVAVPAQHAALTTIELPPRSSGAPIEQIAGLEIARLQRLEPGSFELALLELPAIQNRAGRAGAGTFIAATTSHAEGENLSAAFDGSGLAVVALVPESLAIAKAAALSLESRAVVSLTWSGMEMVVIDQNAHVVYHRALPELGLHRVESLAKERLSLSPDAMDGTLAALACGDRTPAGDVIDDSLKVLAAGLSRLVLEHADLVAVEVERSLTYADRFSGDGVQKPIRIVGAGAGIAGLPERLASQLSLAVTPLVCGETLRVPAAVRRLASSPTLSAAIGASIWTQAGSERMVA